MAQSSGVLIDSDGQRIAVFRVTPTDWYAAANIHDAIRAAAADHGLEPWDIADDRDPPRRVSNEDVVRAVVPSEGNAGVTTSVWDVIRSMSSLQVKYPARIDEHALSRLESIKTHKEAA